MSQIGIHIKFYAAARDAFGANETFVQPDSVLQIFSKLSENNSALEQVLKRCSVLIDGDICHNHERVLLSGESLDILPPFAGG
jgi:molybdopterin converting factor small subunit